LYFTEKASFACYADSVLRNLDKLAHTENSNVHFRLLLFKSQVNLHKQIFFNYAFISTYAQHTSATH